MDRKPFSGDELIVKGEYSSFAPGVHGLPKLNTPVTLRENYQMFLRGETPYWMPSNSNPGTVAVINGNYALQAGLHVSDALATEDASLLRNSR